MQIAPYAKGCGFALLAALGILPGLMRLLRLTCQRMTSGILMQMVLVQDMSRVRDSITI